MHRELERDAAGIANAFPYSLRNHQVVAVAWGQIATGLRDTDDRPVRLELCDRQPEVRVALEIQRAHVGMRWIIEPVA
jgi:hypothetical protein